MPFFQNSAAFFAWTQASRPRYARPSTWAISWYDPSTWFTDYPSTWFALKEPHKKSQMVQRSRAER